MNRSDMSKNKPVILVVDDDPTVLEMVYEGLIQENFEVIAALRPDEALSKIKNRYIDIALLDLDLGWKNITGIELGHRLHKEYDELLVIIMTGYHNLKFAVNAMREHAFQYLIKPFRIDQIVSLAERAHRELSLIKENQELKITVISMEKELSRLQGILDQIRPEEAGLTMGSKEKNPKKISNSDALSSYERQKKAALFTLPKK